MTSLDGMKITLRKRSFVGSKIIINVSGEKFETFSTTLMKYPNTLLGSERIMYFFDKGRKEYFFDRDPFMFKYILNYYRTGKLHCSFEDCPSAFEEELQYFGFSVEDIHECWEECKPKDKIIIDFKDDYEDAPMPGGVQFPSKECKCPHGKSRCARQQYACTKVRIRDNIESMRRKIWHWTGPSKSTVVGYVLNAFFGFFIFLSVLLTVVETIECEDDFTCEEAHSELFFFLDSICVGIFTAEYLVRLWAAPERWKYIKNKMHVIDLLTILPYYLTLAIGEHAKGWNLLRVLRVCRIIKLTRNSRRLYCVAMTLKFCAMDLLFVFFLAALFIILFGSIVFALEKLEYNDTFISIPDTFWWACVTLMTVGYGDVVPNGILARLLGVLCTLCGILLIALPVPILHEKQVPCRLDTIRKTKKRGQTGCPDCNKEGGLRHHNKVQPITS